jgi:hypothetical protein
VQVPKSTDNGGGESNGARLAKIIVPSVVGGLIVIAALLACLLVGVLFVRSATTTLLQYAASHMCLTSYGNEHLV